MRGRRAGSQVRLDDAAPTLLLNGLRGPSLPTWLLLFDVGLNGAETRMSDAAVAPQDQRDQLIERARVGEITGDEADAEAVRLGLGSLSRTPAPEEFRPEAETLWTIPMAVAWIVYLDLEEVREWSAPYREACSHWIWRRHRLGFDGPIYEGWFLEDRSRPTLALLGMGAAWDSREDGREQKMTVSEAQEALWTTLREGFFVASGIDFKTGRRIEIPALDWNELVPVQGKGESDEVRFGLMGDGYRDVLVPARAMQGFWKKPREKHELWTPLMTPEGDGYMPLYCAAQWIATEGGAVDFDADDESKWRPAFDQLLNAIASEKVRVLGVRGGAREPVPGFHFAGCLVDYPYASTSLDMIFTETMYLRSTPYDQEHWHHGFDDALVSRHKDYWNQLMVERGDVRERWPFALALRGTGAPGRPTKSIFLIVDEFERRAASGTCMPTLREEATALLAWIKFAHPQRERPVIKTIENNIRRSFKAQMTTPK